MNKKPHSRARGSGGSASPKRTDFNAKRDSQHKIESRSDTHHPVKSGRNMGGRDLLGDRVRKSQGRAGA